MKTERTRMERRLRACAVEALEPRRMMSVATSIQVGQGSAQFSDLYAVGSRVFFFAAVDGKTQLYRSDGTEAGTIALATLSAPAAPKATAARMTGLGDWLVFSAQSGGETELWRSDGTPEGTVRLKDIAAGAASSNPANLTPVGDRVYFTATGAEGTELWKTDGTEAGTVLVADLNPGKASANPVGLAAVGERVIFSATVEGKAGLWAADGAGVTKLADGVAQTGAAAVGGLAYFAYDGALWKTDGTAAGTAAVKQMLAWIGTPPRDFTGSGSKVFFVAPDPASREMMLWSSDGTAGGTVEVTTVEPRTDVTGEYPMAALPGGMVAFPAQFPNSVAPVRLWVSDGTQAGTRQAMSADLAITLDLNHRFLAVRDQIFFVGADPTHGYELWRTDAAAQGTYLVLDLKIGEGDLAPDMAVNAQGSVYFVAAGSAGTTDATQVSRLKKLWKLPTVQAADAKVVVQTKGAGVAQFPVKLSGASKGAVQVSYATVADGPAVKGGSTFAAAKGVVTIPAGETTGVVQVPVKGGTKPGTQTFGLKLSSDAEDVVITDDSAVAEVTTAPKDGFPGTTGGADFVPEFVSAPSGPVKGNAKAQAVVRVTNRGTGASISTGQVALYLSEDDVISEGDILLRALPAKLNLKPNKAVTLKFVLSYPVQANGTYHLLARADSGSLIAESNEQNNDAASAGTIEIAPAYIDLTVGFAKPFAGTVSRAGNPPVASVRIGNGGTAAQQMTGTGLRLIASLDGVLDETDMVLFDGAVAGTINAGGSRVFNVSVPIPAGLAGGTYRVFAVVDPAGAVAEKEKGNNVGLSEGTLTVG